MKNENKDSNLERTEEEDLLKKDSKQSGYNLTVSEKETEEARQDGYHMMENIQELYKSAEKGEASNVVLSEAVIRNMVEVLSYAGVPVIYGNGYDEMWNSEYLESFLKNAQNGTKDSISVYQIYRDGGMGRDKFIFDGTNMYLLQTRFSWSGGQPVCQGSVYSQIRRWNYTEKGWFIYEIDLPEAPEVTEVMTGNFMLRVKPMKPGYRETAIRYLLPIGYQGNNLFFSDWDETSMEIIDYNGLFECLYVIEHGEKFPQETYLYGIPGEEFENLMTKYLPVTPEQLREYAAYETERGVYTWNRLGTFNYVPNLLAMSIPEITAIEDLGEGRYQIQADAVCERAGDDRYLSHELLVEITGEGIRFLGNKVSDGDRNRIPVYRYRAGE